MLSSILSFIIIIICVYGKSYNLPYPTDLSHILDEETLAWNHNVVFQLTDPIKLENPFFYAANNFTGAEHIGTHLDAPFHFNKNGWKVADIPIHHLISAGVMIDVKEKVKNKRDFQLLPLHLEEWEKDHGKINNNAILLINFGWASKYRNRTEYFGNNDRPYNFPGISAEAAEWIWKSGKIIGVGVDTPSLDFGKSTNFETHRILNQKNIYGIENLALDTSNLPVKGFDLIVMPMKIREGTGAPCRVVAI